MKDPQQVFNEAIDEVIEEARKEGLSLYQWLEKHFKEFSEEAVLDGLYDNFMDMYIHNVASEFSGVVPQSFEEFLREAEKALTYRLDALRWSKRTKDSGFEPLKRSGIIEEVKGLPKGFGEPLSSDDIDFFEMIMRKTLETIRNYLNHRERYKEWENKVKSKFEEKKVILP